MEKIPETLDEAIEILMDSNKDYIDDIKKMSEDNFLGATHHTAGQFVRNTWFLWWHEGHEHKKWPNTKPKLNQLFNDLGIFHADDMSGIIFTSFYRTINGLDIKLTEQIKHYQDYWKTQGFEDGIPKDKI